MYYKKMKLQKKVGEATINLLTSLSGAAWTGVEHLSGAAWTRIEHLSEPATQQDDGFMTVVQELDKAFQYDHRVEMPKALERYFYQPQRRPDQTLLQFCGEVREAT